MNINNAMKLLGLMTILTMASVYTNAYAFTAPTLSVDSVNADDTINYTCTDPVYDDDEAVATRTLYFDTDDPLFGLPEVTLSATCDNTSHIADFSSAGYPDFDSVNLRLKIVGDGGTTVPHVSTTSDVDLTFNVADNTKPTVNAPATPSTELTNTDTFDENTCTVTDNDIAYGTQSCNIISGGIDTSDYTKLGVLQTVDFGGNADGAGNIPVIVSRSVMLSDTIPPVLTKDLVDPVLVKNVDPVPTLTATISDNDNSVDGNSVTCIGTVDNTISGHYQVDCDFADPSGNDAIPVSYDVEVVDGQPPVITLTDTDLAPTLTIGTDTYTEQGGTCSDPEDNPDPSVIIGGDTVDDTTAGTYTVTYDCTDASGNNDHIERIVTVQVAGADSETQTSANGQGDLSFATDFGNIDATTLSDGNYIDPTRPQNAIFPFGLFDFTITGISPGDTVTVTVTLPATLPENGRYYKVNNGLYTDATSLLGSNNGDNLVTITITDGGFGDDDGLANGSISDPGGFAVILTKPVEGSTCAGDCYHPHFGVDQNGKVFYDDGLMIDNLQYKIDNVLHNPYSALYLNVGEPVTFKLKAMDNTAQQIRHMELALSIPKGDFDKQKAQVIIDLNLGWDGKNTITYEGDKSLVSNVSSDVTKTDKIVTWALTLTPTQKLDHDMFAISAVDEYSYPGTYYINEGIKITGISQNGVPEFDYLDAKGYNHHLTIVDQTLEDLSVAIDEQGHKWTLDAKSQFWMKEFIRPDMKCSISSSGYSRNCITEFHEAKLIEQAKAQDLFDSSKLQKNVGDSKTIIPGGYGRLHDPVPNMMKAYADYAIYKASHS